MRERCLHRNRKGVFINESRRPQSPRFGPELEIGVSVQLPTQSSSRLFQAVGIIRGVRKNNSSEVLTLVLLRRNSRPMTGRLPTIGTSVMFTWVLVMITPPTTIVEPSATVTRLSAACVSNAGTP